jgi:hypothetical protein
MSRYTFVVQVHPDGIATLENLITHERIRLDELTEIGPRIERWLAELAEPEAAIPDERLMSGDS